MINIAKLRGSKSLDFLFEKFRLGKQNQRESNPNHQCSVPFLPPGVPKEIERKILGTLKNRFRLTMWMCIFSKFRPQSWDHREKSQLSNPQNNGENFHGFFFTRTQKKIPRRKRLFNNNIAFCIKSWSPLKTLGELIDFLTSSICFFWEKNKLFGSRVKLRKNSRKTPTSAAACRTLEARALDP